ncbi:MAG: virulence RhuM family protein [Nitrospira sp.]|nr:virulence RhuM family protein [Nitrospira sp.]MCA9457791.1 virulence RhuM family protein [Nitrospira sp.]
MFYRSLDGMVQLEARLTKDTVWLTQEQWSQLFRRERSVITKHIRNAFKERGLPEKSNVQNLHIAGSDKTVRFYTLGVVIYLGYRVQSKRGTQLRIWCASSCTSSVNTIRY